MNRMKTTLVIIVACGLAGCATTQHLPESDQNSPPAESGSNGWMIVTGLLAGVALAVALSGGDDDEETNDRSCGGPTPAAHCIDL